MLKSFASLRSRAILLVLLAILPLLTLTLYSFFDQRQLAIREVQRQELVTARNLDTIQETLINNTRQLLSTLARLPQVQHRDRGACDPIFAGLLAQATCYASLGAADPEGHLFASAPVLQEPVNVGDRLYFRKAIETGGFVVGEPVLGRVSKKYSLVFAYPMLDAAGRSQGVLIAGLDLDWLGSQLAKSDFPPGTAMGLTDATGKALFRYPEPLKYIGRMLPQALIKAMNSSDEGVAEGGGLPGDQRLFAFTRLPPPWQELRVAIGLPRAWAIDQVNRNLWRNLIWLVAVTLITLAAARFGGTLFILQPVDKLLQVTRRLTHGDLTARAGSPNQPGELGQLAQGFDHMADSLQAREADLQKTAAELQERVQELDRRSVELAASNKELENFTYSVAHDLRAPLRAMAGFARILLEDYPEQLDAEGRRYLNIIQQEARKLGQLIDDLLDLARLGRKELGLTRLDMAELAQAVFDELKAAHPERDLQIEVQPLPAVLGDRDMFRQLLANLLDNAIKFTQDREPALIQVSGWSAGQENIYCIKDNGVGFDMRYVNKLFEVFQRLHSEEEYGGTGVGLAIVQRIIDRHGGRVWAESKFGEGATICFALPEREDA